MTTDTPRGRLGREVAATFVLALPIVVGQLLTVAMNTIDTVLAGRLGTQVLAAVSQGYQIWVVVLLVVIGVMLAVTPSAAQLDGAGRRDAVGAVFRQALWLALFAGALLLLAVRQGEPLLRLARVSPEIVPDAVAFLRAISWGAPALALFFACKNTSEGLSLSRPTMYFSLLGVAVLFPVAWVLMYGRLGIPALGAAGAGYAHAAALWAQALGFLVYLALRGRYREARLFARFDPPDPRAILGLLRIGVPMGTALFMEGGLFVATALLVGSLGAVPAGAHAIAINFASLTFMVPLGIAMATTVRVGNAVGRRDAQAIADAARASLVLVLGAQALSAGAMFAFPQAIAGLYTDDAAVVLLAGGLLWYAAVFQFSDGIQALANGALRGLKDTALPAAITVLAYWGIGFPVGWWLGLHEGWGAAGLWVGLIAGLTVAATLLTARFVARVRRFRREGVPEALAGEAPPPAVH
jgi:MATE family multidrug resistance protein